MKKIAIIGAGHLGQQIAYHISNDTPDKIVGYFDDFQTKGAMVESLPVLGKINETKVAYQKKMFDSIIIGIGYKHLEFKKQLFEEFDGVIPLYTFIHSTAHIDPTAKIGKGCVIYPRCVIDKSVEINDNVLLNVSCTIAHDTIIDSHSFLSPCVAIAGFTKIGKQCILGINSTIIDNIQIPNKVQIGGGGVVIKSIPQQGLYVGNPVKFIR